MSVMRGITTPQIHWHEELFYSAECIEHKIHT